ncbi:unnamed protein product, partial [Nesidiocoris tenuis]
MLSEKGLTFESAVKIVTEAELVSEQARVMEDGAQQHNEIYQVKGRSYPTGQASTYRQQKHSSNGRGPHPVPAPQGKQSSFQGSNSTYNSNKNIKNYRNKSGGIRKCTNCARFHANDPDQCPAQNWVCFACNRRGHTAKCCRTNNVHFLELEEQSINQIADDKGPLFTRVRVNGVEIFFECDTGCARTLIPSFVFNKFFQNEKLSPVTTNLVAANGQSLTILGEITVSVTCRDKCIKLSLIVAGKELKRSLLGRDWLAELKPNWRNAVLPVENSDASSSAEEMTASVSERKAADS